MLFLSVIIDFMPLISRERNREAADLSNGEGKGFKCASDGRGQMKVTRLNSGEIAFLCWGRRNKIEAVKKSIGKNRRITK